MSKLLSNIVGFTFEGAQTTRFPNVYVWKQDRGIWRVLTTDDLGFTDITGTWYATKAEALSVLPEVNRVWFGESA